MTGPSRSRLYELLKSGDMEFVKVGASTLIPTDSFRRYLDSKWR